MNVKKEPVQPRTGTRVAGLGIKDGLFTVKVRICGYAMP